MKKFLLLPFLLMLTAFKCGPFEKNARDVIATATGAIQQAQVEYQKECSVLPSAPKCVLINQAIYVQNIAITGLEIYCGFQVNVTLPSATCTPVKSARAALDASLSQLSNITGQITALLHSNVKAIKIEISDPPTYAEIESVRIQEGQ